MATLEQLHKVMPNAGARLSKYFPHLTAAMTEFEINTPLREAAFLAQLAHESGELRFMEEIADGSAYEGRKDLGNTRPGDGKLYKGRGPIQLTGRANYKKYGELLVVDLINNPSRAATPEVGFRIAGQYWVNNRLNELADREDFREITKRINGGYNGLTDREKYYARAKKVLGKSEPVGFVTEPQSPPIEVSAEDAAKGVTTGQDPDKVLAGATAGTQGNAPESGPPPPAQAVEVKASRPSIKSTAVAILTFLMGPLSYVGIDARQVGEFAKGNLTLALKIATGLAFVVIAIWVWDRAMERANMRTLKVIDKASDKDAYSVRLVGGKLPPVVPPTEESK